MEMDFADKKVLVTGAAGFIGSALIWELNKRGCEMIIASDYLESSEKWRNLVPLKYWDYIEADSLFAVLDGDYLEKFDLILHMGACSATTENDASYLIRNNYEFTKNLAEWALINDVRFIYASSAATYGDGSAGMSDQLSELHRLRPLNMYGYSKHMFDLFAQTHDFLDQIVGLKFFNVFGPNENHKGSMRSVVHKAFDQVMDKGHIKLFKSYREDFQHGCQQRDFLYVKDAVQMVLHLAASPDASGLYNLGSGLAHTWLDLAHAVFSAMDLEPHIQFIEMPDELRDKYQYFTQADISRLRDSGYQQQPTKLEDAVADTITNYLRGDHRLGDESLNEK